MNEEEDNRDYAAMQDGAKSSAGFVEVFYDHVEIIYGSSNKAPTCIKYTEKGFIDQLNNAMRKAYITPRIK